MVFHFIFRSMMHFEAIFVKEVKYMSRSFFFFFYTVDVQCSHTINEKTVFVSCSPRPWDPLSLTS